MFKKLMKKYNELEKTLSPQTKTCKLCFKKIDDNSVFGIILNNQSLCFNCYKKLQPKFQNFKHCGVNCLAIYDYDDEIKSLIYQFKGCGDFELKDIFLERFLPILKIIYSNFIVVPIPSSKSDDEKRGFNHVNEMFKSLKLKMDYRIIKNTEIKQSDQSAKERSNIKKYLSLTSNDSLKGKKILLVDDIFTTGSTIKSCIELIKTLNPKQIKVLVICKTPTKNNITNSNAN